MFKTSQMEDVNCAPRFEVILAGTPNLEIQPEIRALAQSAVEMEDIGTASGQREVLFVEDGEEVGESSGMVGRGYLSGTMVVLCGSPHKVSRFHQVQGLYGEDFTRVKRTFSILRNSALAEASLSGSRWCALAKTGGPGTVGRSWKTPCFGVEAEKPSEERTSGYSERSFLISLGAAWRFAQ